MGCFGPSRSRKVTQANDVQLKNSKAAAATDNQQEDPVKKSIDIRHLKAQSRDAMKQQEGEEEKEEKAEMTTTTKITTIAEEEDEEKEEEAHDITESQSGSITNKHQAAAGEGSESGNDKPTGHVNNAEHRSSSQADDACPETNSPSPALEDRPVASKSKPKSNNNSSSNTRSMSITTPEEKDNILQFLEVLDVQAKHGGGDHDTSKSNKLEATSKRHRKIREFIDEHFSAELSTWDLEGEPNVHLLGKIQTIQAELDNDIQSLRQTCEDIEGKLETTLQEKRDLVAERKDREEQLASYSKELDALRQENLKLRQHVQTSGDEHQGEEEQQSLAAAGSQAEKQDQHYDHQGQGDGDEDDSSGEETDMDQIKLLDIKAPPAAENQSTTGSQGVVRKTTSHIVAKRVVEAMTEECQHLRANIKDLSEDIVGKDSRIEMLEARLRASDDLRRKLTSSIQELRGNIRVICRVRPWLNKLVVDDFALKSGNHNSKMYAESITFPSAPHLMGRAIEVQFSKIATTPHHQLVPEIKSVSRQSSTKTSQEGGRKKNLPIDNHDGKHSQLFVFDRVLDPSSTQQDVFEEVLPIVQSTIDGSRACIFSYGQTGSGKTYSLLGNEDILQNLQDTNLGDQHCGIVPRSLSMLQQYCEEAEACGEWKCTLDVSAVQIYNESVLDLLAIKRKPSYSNSNYPEYANRIDSGNKAVQISTNEKRAINRNSVIPGAAMLKVESPKDVATVIQTAVDNRVAEDNGLNANSSRSHCVFVARLLGVRPAEYAGRNGESTSSSGVRPPPTPTPGEPQKTAAADADGMSEESSAASRDHDQVEHPTDNEVLLGCLAMVDLAGSERLTRSEVAGDRLKETKAINKSLSALGDVMSALSSSKTHVPYRNSKLTYLLEPCLGGEGSKSLMLVNIAPGAGNVSESLFSLKFANKTTKATTVRK